MNQLHPIFQQALRPHMPFLPSNDFEVHPLGTARRLDDMATELSILRRDEAEVADLISADVADDIKGMLDHKVTA